VDAARFEAGMTYEAFKAGMQQNRERLEAGEAVEIDARDVAYFRSLRPLHCLAIVEEWCADVVANLPVVATLAREVGPSFELRCFTKAQVPDLVAAYLNRGRFESVPVFAFFDADWREVGAIIERPVAVTEHREEQLQRIHAEHPEFGPPDAAPSELDEDARAALMAEIQAQRAADVPWAARQLILAIRDSVARAPQVGDRVAAAR
jgi:hypothetical protein